MKKIHGNTKNTPESIEARLDKTGDCWVWKENCDKDGYGRVCYHGKEGFVHRMMYGWHVGPLDPQLLVMHSCDNPPCANPAHLRQGTHADNIADAVQKGRKSSKGMKNPNAKLTEYQVKTIRQLYASGTSQHKLSLMFNVSRRTIHKIVYGKSWEEERLVSVEGVAELGDTDVQVSTDELDAVGVQAS